MVHVCSLAVAKPGHDAFPAVWAAPRGHAGPSGSPENARVGYGNVGQAECGLSSERHLQKRLVCAPFFPFVFDFFLLKLLRLI